MSNELEHRDELVTHREALSDEQSDYMSSRFFQTPVKFNSESSVDVRKVTE